MYSGVDDIVVLVISCISFYTVSASGALGTMPGYNTELRLGKINLVPLNPFCKGLAELTVFTALPTLHIVKLYTYNFD